MDPNRLRSRTRVTTCKFQDALSSNNRFRSRTRVTTFKFQSALNLRNRLRSRTRVKTFKFQECVGYKTKLKLEKSSGLEVGTGMFRAAHQTYFEIYGSSIGV